MPLATRELHGLRISISIGHEEIMIHPGRCRDFDDRRDIGIGAGENRIIDPSRIGLGGLDTGTIQPCTSYAVYLVRQGNDTEGMLSRAFDPDSADPPSFPNDGSLSYRRIGAVVTDRDGRFLMADQEGNDLDRRYRFQASEPELTVLKDGTAIEFTPFELAPYFHHHARRALIAVQPNNAISVTIARNSNGAGATIVETPNSISFEAAEGNSPTVGHYRNARQGGSATIVVLGFEETL